MIIFSVCPLIVDAQIIYNDWTTYFGGNLTTITQIELDKSGKYIYIVGYTADTGIATVGANKEIFNPIDTPPSMASNDLLSWKADAFLSKIDINGNVIWSTYIGGRHSEMLPTIALDYSGNILIYGLTKSIDNIATIGSHIDSKTDTSYFSYFLMKFDSLGNKIWGTYYDTNSSNVGLIISPLTIDQNDNIYIGGACQLSSTNMSTIGSYLPFYNGGSNDGFLAKFDKYGNRIWGTYIGGFGDDAVGTIINKSNDAIFIVGSTNSLNQISTLGTYQYEPLNDIGSYFLMKIDAITGHKIWGTYISTENVGMYLFDASIDAESNIYIYGTAYEGTTGITGESIATSGTHQENLAGEYDVILMKFDSTGNKVWGTYYGGLNIESNEINRSGLVTSTTYNNTTISVTEDGSNILIAGYTSSTDGIDESGCGYVPTTANRDGFIANFNGNTGKLNWDTYYDAEINDIELDASNPQQLQIYFTTRTNIDSLATAGAFKENKTGLYTSGLFGKLYVACPLDTPRLAYTYPDLSVDTGYESYTWYHNGVAVSSGDADTYTPGVDTTGFYYAVVQKCGCTYTTDTFYFDDMGIGNQGFAQHFQLFPNPTEHSIQLRVLNPNLSIKETDIYVYNLLGQSQAIKITQLGAQQYQIDLNDLPAGTYQILLRNQKGQWSQKVVKW